MPKLYNCTNCQKMLQEAPLMVLEDGHFKGLILCSWRCMEQHAVYEADQEEDGDEQSP
jgi:hypothetical protein